MYRVWDGLGSFLVFQEESLKPESNYRDNM